MKIAIYSRKSRYTGKGESIENQVEMCRNYIEQHMENPYEIEIFEDEGFSGKNLDRPQFQKMLGLVNQGYFQYVVCYRLDRISRNVSDFSSLIEKLQKKETAFLCIKEQFDTSTPMGRAMMYIASVFSQLERETIAERVRDNMMMLAKTGRWLGGNLPLGYQSSKEEIYLLEGKVKSCFHLSPIQEELELVSTIYQKFLELQSINSVMNYLMQMCHRTKNGKPFYRTAIRDILRNPVYCKADMAAFKFFSSKNADIDEFQDYSGKYGLIAYNKRKNSQKGLQNYSEWIVAIGRHEGIISGERWVKVQELLEKNKLRKPNTFRLRNKTALLSGLLRCGTCKNYMRPKVRQKFDNAGNQAFSYICQTKAIEKSAGCNMSNINGLSADNAIWNTFCRYIEQIPFVLPDIKMDKHFASKKTTNSSNRQKQLFEKKEEIKKLRQSAASLKKDNIIMKYILPEIQKLQKECDQLEKITTDHIENFSDAISLQTIAEGFFSPEALWTGLSILEKRELLKTCISEIYWDGAVIHIYLLGSNITF